MGTSFDQLALISVPYLCQVDPERAEHHALLSEVAAECLDEFGLSVANLSARFRTDPMKFEILLGDLTAEGLAFARTGFQRWLGNSDRWKSERTRERYRAALLRQWEKSRGKSV
jgi:hypothetical protein